MFRLKLHHHREVVLLKEKVKASHADSKVRREEMAAAHRDMLALPVLTSTLNG